jgi:N-acetylated-alpha-linked acidic dipeptidase
MNIARAVVTAAVLVSVAILSARQRATGAAVAREISIANVERTLHAIDVDRTSGSEGERRSAEYLDRQLAGYGVAHTIHEARLFLSWPGRAEITAPGVGTLRGKTAAFSAATTGAGVRGALAFDPALKRRVDQSFVFESDVRGRIPVVRGIADTESLVLAGQHAGAVAVIQIDDTDILHEDIVTTIWGTPTTESALRMPAIPYVCITKSDGERLTRAAANGPLPVTVAAEVARGWRTIPVVVADVRGRTPEFVLVATHLDAWYHGMTDTGGSVASILEMARVLHQHAGELDRGVRFAWWTGHSFGRYAASGWYADRFWLDLDSHAVAYTNLDGPGRRGSRVDSVSAAGWPGLAEYARESAERIGGKAPLAARGASGVFRPGRDSDSAFQGLGIPFFSVGVPGPERGSPDVDAAGRIVYWHTAEDTFDKLDLKTLELDTQYRVAQLYELATLRVLPHLLAPIAASYIAALRDLGATAGSVFDLASTLKLALAFEQGAEQFDRAPKPTADSAIAARNALVVRLTHELNSALYTKSGRFDQDPAAALPVLPSLARAKDLSALPREADEFGFLETELIRGRNRIESVLRDAIDAIDHYNLR